MTANGHHLVRLEFSSAFEMLDFVQVVSDHLARGVGLDEDSLHWVSVAIRECVINAIKHGNRSDTAKHVFVEPDAAREVIADHLHEVEHLEGAGEFEPDEVMAVCRHVCVTRHSINTISSVMSRRGAKTARSRKILPTCPCPPPPLRRPAVCAGG